MEYRIEYTIVESENGFETQREVGFGSSGSWGSIEECLHMVESDVQNGCWETEGGPPEPTYDNRVL